MGWVGPGDPGAVLGQDLPVIAHIAVAGQAVLGYLPETVNTQHAIVVLEVSSASICFLDPAREPAVGISELTECDSEDFKAVWTDARVLVPVGQWVRPES